MISVSLSSIFIIILISAFRQSLCLSSQIGFTPNHKYSYVGKSIINVASQIQAANTANWKTTPREVTISYPLSFAGTNPYFYPTLGEFQSNNLANGVSIFIQTKSINNSFSIVVISTTSASVIQKLSVSYVIYKRVNNYLNNFHFYLIKQNSVQLISNNTQSFINNYVQIPSPTINMTGGVNSLAIISGIEVNSANSAINAIDVSVFILPMDYNTVQITISSNSQSYTQISAIYVLFCIYNPNYVLSQSSDYYQFYSGNIQASNVNSMTYKPIYTTASFNTIIGLSAFSLSNQTVFSFYQSATPQNGISITANNTFSSFTFSFLAIYSKYCSYLTPYYQSVTKLCYNVCPSSSTADPSTTNNSLLCLCYINGTLKDNSNCVESNYTQPLSSSNPSQSSSVPIALILGLSIGVLLSIVLLIIVIYFVHKKLKQRKQKQEKQAQLLILSNAPISTTTLGSKSLSLSRRSSNQIRSTITRKISYLQSQKIIIQKQQQNNDDGYKDYEQNSVKWFDFQDQFQPKCYVCNQEKAYLQISCRHSFHYQCLIAKVKEMNCCPQCLQAVDIKASYYCSECCQRYRVIGLDCFRMHSGFSTICDECKTFK